MAPNILSQNSIEILSTIKSNRDAITAEMLVSAARNKKISEKELKSLKEHWKEFKKKFPNDVPALGLTFEVVDKANTLLNPDTKQDRNKLLPIKGISKVMQARLRDNHITNVATLLYNGSTTGERQELQRKITGASHADIYSWVKQANLWQINGMTADMAYLLVLIGVRHILDLSKIDAAKAAPLMQCLSRTLTDFTFEENELEKVIAEAKKFVAFNRKDKVLERKDNLQQPANLSEKRIRELFATNKQEFIEKIKSTDNKISRKDFDKFFDQIMTLLPETVDLIRKEESEEKAIGAAEIEPDDDDFGPSADLLANDAEKEEEEKEQQDEAKKYIANIVNTAITQLGQCEVALPLPVMITGALDCKEDENYAQHAKISIDGVVATQEDPDKKLETNSGIDGNFAIALPGGYSLKEIITFTITQKGYDGKAKELTIVKTQAELKKAMKCYAEGSNSCVRCLDWSDTELLTATGLEEGDKKDLTGEEQSKLDKIGEVFKALLKDKQGNKTEITDDNRSKIAQSVRQAIVNNLTDDDLTANITLGIDSELFAEPRATESGNALPMVRLMGEEENEYGQNTELNLKCDTAPVESFHFMMLQRLMAPKISDKNGTKDRGMVTDAIDVVKFKNDMATNPSDYLKACTLGIGYVLNMHQGWAPDGFSLGTMLYSLVLAPGEEQRLIVRENTQTFSITDTATGTDNDTQSYEQTESNTVQAIYDYGAKLASNGNSSYDYSTSASSYGGSIGGSVMGSCFGLSGSFSASKSSAKGDAHSSASQVNTQDEASTASQNFQQSIRTASQRISEASRISMSLATSQQTDQVATKIIANHNHSHAMTVQYWEVMRNYRLESNIDSVDLVLYVPLKLVQFLPAGQKLIYKEDVKAEDRAAEISKFSMSDFSARYGTLLKHATELQGSLPWKYRTGLGLIQKYAAYPHWTMENVGSTTGKTLTLKISGYFLSFDDINISLVLKNGKGRVAGNTIYNRLHLPNVFKTKDELTKALMEIRNGNNGFIKEKINYYLIPGNTGYIESPKAERTAGFDEKVKREVAAMSFNLAVDYTDLGEEGLTPCELTCTFNIPNETITEDISYIEIQHSCETLDYSLYKDFKNLKEHEWYALFNMVNKEKNLAQDNDHSNYDRTSIAHYLSQLPEAFRNSLVRVNPSQYGQPQFSIISLIDEHGKQYQAISSSASLSRRTYITISGEDKTLRYSEFQKMEETLLHVASNGMRYSQIVWASLTEDERAMLLEPYNMDLGRVKSFWETDPKNGAEQNGTTPEGVSGNKEEEEEGIPLLNCIDVKRVLGFYGNCMLFPFTFPEEMAQKTGITALDLQNRIYNYHVNSYRVPTTRISVPTKGMVGEAVLGDTNVSEKIDITRFWNWKDSPIDSMQLDSSYLNGTDYLSGKTTKDISALNLQGATAATPTTPVDLLSGMIAKQPAHFDNITGLDQLKEVLNAGTTSAQTGLNTMVTANKELASSAMNSVADVKKQEMTAKTEQAKAAADAIKTLMGGSTSASKDASGNSNQTPMAQFLNTLPQDQKNKLFSGLIETATGIKLGGEEKTETEKKGDEGEGEKKNPTEDPAVGEDDDAKEGTSDSLQTALNALKQYIQDNENPTPQGFFSSFSGLNLSEEDIKKKATDFLKSIGLDLSNFNLK